MKKFIFTLLLFQPISLYSMVSNNNPAQTIKVLHTQISFQFAYGTATTISDLKNKIQNVEGIDPQMQQLFAMRSSGIFGLSSTKVGPLANSDTLQNIVNTHNPEYLALTLKLRQRAPGS